MFLFLLESFSRGGFFVCFFWGGGREAPVRPPERERPQRGTNEPAREAAERPREAPFYEAPIRTLRKVARGGGGILFYAIGAGGGY